MKKLSSTLPNMLLSLGGICVLVSGILAVVNKVTTAPIAEAEMRAKVEAIRAVAPAFDNNPFAEKLMVLPEGETDSLTVYPAKKGSALVGFAIESYTQKGFSGYELSRIVPPMKPLDIIRNGIATENPTFVLLLGMCPTLATTTSALNGLAMGLATMFVLICSNTAISLIKHLVPDAVRIPSFIVVIAGFVTIVQMLMQAFVPSLYASLGLFIPLIVVNCIVLGRAEAVAAKQGVLHSALDGVGIGLGFTLSLTLLGFVREFLGSGSIFTLQVLPKQYGALLFVLAPGAFLVLGYLIALKNKLSAKK